MTTGDSGSFRDLPLRTRSRPPRIITLRVRRYRALRDIQLEKLSGMTVLIGPNGSGKSTLFDVFAFLDACFSKGVWAACEERGGLGDIRSRGTHGPVAVELEYREWPPDFGPQGRLLHYQLEVDERDGRPVVSRETLRWKGNPGPGRSRSILNFENGQGEVFDEGSGSRREEALAEPDMLAVNTLGQLKGHPRIEALRRFISGWYLSYFSSEEARGVPRSGPQERLTRTADNLGNVLQYLKQRDPSRLRSVLGALRDTVPGLERADYETTVDGRLVVLFKDKPFQQPVLSKFASDGTVKMLAYLVLLSDPTPPPFIGIEEPENQLYHSLLPGLADLCRQAADRSQVLVTTHSHEFVNACQPNEVIALYRESDGFTRAVPAAHNPSVRAMLESGGKLGHLWQEGYFDVPRPITPGETCG
ncbi:putative ATPase [Streptoalloteichus tenebrarius]|uniref:ATPase n=1 Tax=Streptoalloteichus tenebrarius (strain ATCC 17920 / DSM 40477 / JCM 4838 / CBS 697.72 / NBRC 16177 / NCIMB 11028 / NRRL B-12390 / A12253. 1 / ISP 5477) TaxID=1933 RepID=A0ABT1HSC9_STRSD|nr:AAA family ATPase [Streptoalloteichus tenebrarius]MCP2258431.1 putative ATPase [Streptoalloteichus tenebrarius]BFF03601.1 AAA family ATPase [Streptoalloteichus tenebrarius]